VHRRAAHVVRLLQQLRPVAPDLLQDVHHVLLARSVLARHGLVREVVALRVGHERVHAVLLDEHARHGEVAVVHGEVVRQCGVDALEAEVDGGRGRVLAQLARDGVRVEARRDVDGRPAVALAVHVQPELLVQPRDDGQEVLLGAEVHEGLRVRLQALAQAVAVGVMQLHQMVEHVVRLHVSHHLVLRRLLDVFFLHLHLRFLLNLVSKLLLVPHVL